MSECNKVQYADKKSAALALARMDRIVRRGDWHGSKTCRSYYRCECGAWHLTAKRGSATNRLRFKYRRRTGKFTTLNQTEDRA